MITTCELRKGKGINMIKKFVKRISKGIVCATMAGVLILSGSFIPGANTHNAEMKVYAATNYNPEGCVDTSVSNKNNQITCTGWVLDRDNPTQQIDIHIYIGGPAGSGAPMGVVKANTYRPDVNKYFGNTVGDYHGFSCNVNISNMVGPQEVYIYGINVGGGSNQLIGTKTVTIKGGKLNTISGSKVISEGYYKVVSQINNSSCLDISDCNKDNNANCHLWQTCSDANNQNIKVEYLSNGLYRMVFSHSGKVLDAHNGLMYNGVNVKQYDYCSVSQQHWIFVPRGNGYYSIHSAKNPNYVVDVSGGNSSNGTNIQLYQYNASDAQLFKFVPISSYSNSAGIQVTLNVPSYKQYDYPNTYIGNKTIKAIGCTLTSCAMAYSYNSDTNTTPDVMKKKLSFSNNDLYWSSLSNVKLSYTSTYDTKITNSIMTTIYSKLKSGRPVVIGAKNSSGGQHWVCIYAYQGNTSTSFNASSFKINDPNSTTRTTLKQFLDKYPTVLRLIF